MDLRLTAASVTDSVIQACASATDAGPDGDVEQLAVVIVTGVSFKLLSQGDRPEPQADRRRRPSHWHQSRRSVGRHHCDSHWHE